MPLADCMLISGVSHGHVCLLAGWDLTHGFNAPADPPQSIAQTFQCSSSKISSVIIGSRALLGAHI